MPRASRSSSSAKRKPLLQRALRWLGFAVLGFFLLSFALVLLLRYVDPPTSAIAMQRRTQAWIAGAPYQASRCWRDLSELGPNIALAVVASEDQRFATHWGLDTTELKKAASASGRKRGASTITQQLAKNLFLWHGRSYARKALEAYFALLIELSWSKPRILEVYLNTVEFGPGVYGACAGARRSFQTEPIRLSPYQAGLLAASLPNPHRRFAHQPTIVMHRRAAWITRQMQQLGGQSYLAQLGR